MNQQEGKGKGSGRRLSGLSDSEFEDIRDAVDVKMGLMDTDGDGYISR